MARGRKKLARHCARCRGPVHPGGERPYTVVNDYGTEVPMLERLYEHDCGDDVQGHTVTATVLLPAPPSYDACICCGLAFPSPRRGRHCKPCREGHGGERNQYIASLRCPIREHVEAVDAELQEALGPGSTWDARLGHSEECYGTTPMHRTDAVKARCPACSRGALRRRGAQPPNLRAWSMER